MAEERRQLVEAVAERLALDLRARSSPLGSDKKSTLEQVDDASCENSKLLAVETS